MQRNRLGQAFAPGYVGSAGPGSTGQDSTAAYVAVSNSQMDMADGDVSEGWFQVSEIVGSNGVTVKVQASLDATTWFDVTSTSYAVNATATSSITQAVGAGVGLLISAVLTARYLRLVCVDTSGGSHGTITAIGYAH